MRLDGKTSYTFLIYRDTLSTEYFENLMISTDNETEEQHTFIYRYYNENHPEFPGVIMETFDPLGQDETSNRYSYLDCEWIEELITVEIPCSCAGHYPGEECSCGDDEGETAPYSEFRLVMKYECKRMGSSEGPNWYDWTDGPINPHGPGGGVDMPDVYTSTVSSYLIDLLNCLTLDPGSNEVKWLLGNFLEMRKLSTFLTDNGCSEDAREFARQAIEAFLGDGTSIEDDDHNYDSAFWNSNPSFPQQQLPSFNDFDASYPKLDGGKMPSDQVFNLIGGNVLSLANLHGYTNACAARVSRALNYSGISIPNIQGITFKGADNKYYFLGAKNLFEWMKKTFGAPDISLNESEVGTGGFGFFTSANGDKGIYIMIPNYPAQFGASGHADIFNGSTFNAGGYLNPAGGLHSANLWKLN